VVELVQLGGKEDRRPAQLSGGEKQRVALARSLVLEPELLLLDEPLAALDPNLRAQVREELKALQRRVGIAFLMVTHDQEEAMVMADQMGVMAHGRLEQVGTPREIYEQPRTRFVAGFLGEVNWIGAVGVRPEFIRVSRERVEGERGLSATVASTVFLGHSTRLEAVLASGERVQAACGDGFSRGDEVWVWWRESEELRV
ncbi:MAG: ABC transporter ATP-binding protein, partial [Acidobacteriia bacterium]|nr:ABC transporter ATP-binding protein [Terriglobia bacterium]